MAASQAVKAHGSDPSPQLVIPRRHLDVVIVITIKSHDEGLQTEGCDAALLLFDERPSP